MGEGLTTLISALLVFLFMYALFYFPILSVVNRLVKNGTGWFYKFWGADVYSFDMNSRVRLVKKITKTVDMIVCIILVGYGVLTLF